ncbi:MAG: SGNH/GDSL hydrolase family protein [Phycisphaerales bacterium]|nr:SGNH/GDSL hydrolase family protein [Phycisphaerales bacterium]
MLNRRSFLAASGAAAGAIATGAASASVVRRRAAAEPRWRDVREWGVEGRGWSHTERYFDRLPARAKGVVPDPVWNLSRHASGMSVEFETDATEIRVRYALHAKSLAMSHMAATGVSGLDLYGLDGDRWRWGAVFRPEAQENEGVLVSGIDAGRRRWRVYLPLYNGVESLEIGLPDDATFGPIAPRTERSVVFYGTSILHGACASRPGMAWPSIVSRRIDRPAINLGFSGNGRMEPALADLLAEIDAAAYVIDCAPNMSPELIAERTAPFVTILRRARPETPVVLVEDRSYGYGWLKRASRERNEQNHAALRAAYRELLERGTPGLSYVEGGVLLGEAGAEAMTDGSHPNDLGMTLYAEAIAPVLGQVLR